MRFDVSLLALVPFLLVGRAMLIATLIAATKQAGDAASPLAALLVTAVHTAAYLAVTGIIAWVVYSKFGLAILRKARSISTWYGVQRSWLSRGGSNPNVECRQFYRNHIGQDRK